MSTTMQLPPATDFFPMERPRAAQLEALEFITRAVNKGYGDIVIAAPTGIGKSGIGAAACLWSTAYEIAGHERGGYYLVTQKMLQDQLENDFPRFLARFRTDAGSLKSSIEYPCRRYINCMAGGMASAASEKGSGQRCPQKADNSCPYSQARLRFELSKVAVTNYPYLFTEHMHIGELKPRNVLVADECHTLEKQITNFIEVIVNKDTLDNWAPDCRPVPEMHGADEFAEWLRRNYIVICKTRLEMLTENLQHNGYSNRKMLDEHSKLKHHVSRLTYAIDDMQSHPDDWVFWQELVDDELECTAKPLSAAPFMPQLIDEMSSVRIYLSAYPGPKDVFCRSLGMEPSGVAWLDMDSAFPVENRLIHMTTVGSMGRTWADKTLPRLLKMCETILESHPNEKGIIHSHTYALGQKIYEYFRNTPSAARVLFSTKASERAANFNLHRISPAPTVMLSPSIAEGFSFDDDLARFQIIAKVPYPYIGDRQVAARMKLDRDWYILQTVMSILQACGRIVRSSTDHGTTYILDLDFIRLFEENSKFFPKWFRDAFKFY